jgi:hypothetical protein
MSNHMKEYRDAIQANRDDIAESRNLIFIHEQILQDLVSEGLPVPDFNMGGNEGSGTAH